MKLGTLSVGRDITAGFLIVAAVLSLALSGNINGDAALVSILGVGAALGVYRRVRGGETDGN